MDDQARIVDRLLVARAQGGDEQSFTLLVRRWHPRLSAFCLRLAGEREAAADATQETWLAVVKGLKRLDDPALFRAWLYRIATRKVADHIRANVRERKGKDEMKTAADIQGAERAGSPEDGLAVKDMIARLEPEKRALLLLFYVEGLSVAEISGVLDVPAGTVKSRLFTLREELKAKQERTRP